MREQLLISALLWWGFAEQELGDSSQRLATGWAANALKKEKKRMRPFSPQNVLMPSARKHIFVSVT